jgi:hypothetical protein
MRQDKKGNFITLEEDIQRIWGLHAWSGREAMGSFEP